MTCGIVLSEGSEASGPEWRSFANDGVDKSRTGTGTSITMHDMGSVSYTHLTLPTSDLV